MGGKLRMQTKESVRPFEKNLSRHNQQHQTSCQGINDFHDGIPTLGTYFGNTRKSLLLNHIRCHCPALKYLSVESYE